jgi:hypothetical protein
MSAITVALLSQSIGFAAGFGAWTFRVIQLSAQLAAPLVLAWGLIELAARGTAVRFGARLVGAAVAAVAGVVLATDPLTATPFARSWPAASAHYQIIPHYAGNRRGRGSRGDAVAHRAAVLATRPGLPGAVRDRGRAAVVRHIAARRPGSARLPDPRYRCGSWGRRG